MRQVVASILLTALAIVFVGAALAALWVVCIILGPIIAYLLA